MTPYKKYKKKKLTKEQEEWNKELGRRIKDFHILRVYRGAKDAQKVTKIAQVVGLVNYKLKSHPICKTRKRKRHYG